MAVSASDPQPVSPDPEAHAGRGAANTVHLGAHTCTPTDGPTPPQARTGTCIHTGAPSASHSTPEQRTPPRGWPAVPAPRVRPPERTRAVGLAEVEAGRFGQALEAAPATRFGQPPL
uniref:Uncharacterized protein n=1 Tax=Rangifer tarandus platyrhynchus TaxID=3082113 RepID=A0ACB0DZS9_RANTA|nr:unnamed protein product [Rangifer tarandus platyrhynchus]